LHIEQPADLWISVKTLHKLQLLGSHITTSSSVLHVCQSIQHITTKPQNLLCTI